LRWKRKGSRMVEKEEEKKKGRKRKTSFNTLQIYNIT
jgi:hypothetical protein